MIGLTTDYARSKKVQQSKSQQQTKILIAHSAMYLQKYMEYKCQDNEPSTGELQIKPNRWPVSIWTEIQSSALQTHASEVLACSYFSLQDCQK